MYISGEVSAAWFRWAAWGQRRSNPYSQGKRRAATSVFDAVLTRPDPYVSTGSPLLGCVAGMFILVLDRLPMLETLVFTPETPAVQKDRVVLEVLISGGSSTEGVGGVVSMAVHRILVQVRMEYRKWAIFPSKKWNRNCFEWNGLRSC